MRAFVSAAWIIVGIVAAVRLIIYLWPRVFPSSMTGKLVRAMEAERTARHTDVGLLSSYDEFRTPRSDEDRLPDRAWEDLDLDDVFASIDYAESEPGRQYLRSLLRNPTDSNERLLALERAIERLSTDAPLAESVRQSLRRLRDRRSAFLVELFFGQVPPRPRIWWLFPMLTATSIACLVLARAWPRSLIVWLGVTVLNIGIQVFYKPRVQRFIPAIHELPAFFKAARELGDKLRGEGQPLAHEAAILRAGAEQFGGLKRAASWLMFEPEQANEVVSSICEYLNLLFLLDVNALAAATRSIHQHNADLRSMFEAIGYIDAVQSIARWRAEARGWAVPEFVPRSKSLDIGDVVHPLVAEPVANSLQLEQQSLLITGSNMSGKTTFIRALGINAVLAQTMHTVLATHWRAPMLRVRTSIGRADSVVEGKSYYFAEVETVLALVQSAGSEKQHLFLLDEIFRGTNTTERVAAAAAVLAHLDQGDDLVVVATHDIEVLDLLDESFAARHFREHVDQDGEALTFDYRIQNGRSSTRNAIALLKVMKYPDSLVATALEKLDWVERDLSRAYGEKSL